MTIPIINRKKIFSGRFFPRLVKSSTHIRHWQFSCKNQIKMPLDLISVLIWLSDTIKARSGSAGVTIVNHRRIRHETFRSKYLACSAYKECVFTYLGLCAAREEKRDIIGGHLGSKSQLFLLASSRVACVFLFGNDGIPGAGKQSAKDAAPDDITESERKSGERSFRQQSISSLRRSTLWDAEKMSA